MIIIAILLGIVLALILAIVIVGSGSIVTKQARTIIKKGMVTDVKQARGILKSLGSMPKDMKTRETDELYDDLKRLIDVADTQDKKPVGFRKENG